VIPLYGFLEGDTLGLLVLADGKETIAALADKLRRSARLRVEIEDPIVVLHGGQPLDLGGTVEQAGLAPLDRIDVRSVTRP
jgi:hypothetical protein